MKREVTLEEISDGKRYSSNDMVKADCGGCEGCHSCCQGMGNTVILDPLDFDRLAKKLSCQPSDLLSRHLEWTVVEGMILPYLRMDGDEESCSFLNEEGRCTVHDARPGICRLFPLGRYYENRSFCYFLQVHECKKEARSKVKVKKWLDTPELSRYEAFVTDWHYLLADCQEYFKKNWDDEFLKAVNLYMIREFYLKAYEKENFYSEFYRRLEEAGNSILCKVLGRE